MTTEAAPQLSYYLRLSGVASVTVTDSSGNTSHPMDDQTDDGVAGVTSYITGEDSLDVITSTDQAYTITFRSSTELIDLELAKGTNTETLTQASRYHDLLLPAGTMAMIKITPQGIEDLRYDRNGDGAFETVVAPTVSVIGTAAQDTEPPKVTVSEARQATGTTVTLTATDNVSGVKALYYSLDGSQYQIYTSPFNIDPYRSPVIYVFADDNVANRSSLTTFQLTAPASILQFNAANSSVNEGDGRATITVTRSGDTSGTATVDYATIDNPAAVRCDDITTMSGVAFARCDYATSVDTLSFAPGETQKSFTIPIIDDVYVEGAETVPLRLSNATGATLGAQSTATLTINDNDTTPGAGNPILATPFFVRMQYLDFLSREPEAGEPWSGVLNRCADVNNLDPNSPSAGCDRLSVSSSFFGSPEFQLKGFYVFLFYKVAFNRLAEYSELIPDMRNVTGATPAEVFQKRAAFATGFTGRAEFRNAYDGLSHSAYVNALLARYSLTSITTPDPANPDGTQKVTLTQAELVNRLTANTLTRAQVLRAIVQSDEVNNREYRGTFVAMQYYGYLRRTPETGGYNNWLTYLNAHPADFRTMVNGFMNSVEYKLRFGQP